jgi:hypothetical protein
MIPRLSHIKINKIMKKHLIFLVLVVIAQVLWAQGGDNQGVSKENFNNFQTNLPKDNPDKDIRGSRYSTENYTAGELVMNNGKRFSKELTFKFDEYFNNIQIKFENGKETVLFYNTVDSFRLFVGDKVVNYVKANVPTESEMNKFYQVIYAGANYQLIKLPKKTVVNVDNRDAFGSGEQFKKFENKDVYFLKKGNDKAFEKIKISKKALLEALPSKKEKINKLFDTSAFKGLLDDAKLMALFAAIDL